MMASLNNYLPIVQLLLDKRADVNAKDKVTLLLLFNQLLFPINPYGTI